jgi:hypothetical protein
MLAIKAIFLDWRRPLTAMLIAMVVTLGVTATYVSGPLQGEFKHFFLPAKHWGVPQQLRDRGIDELYLDDDIVGWDGQFYFFIANDPLALRDTAQHVDSNAYRYQRIGLPLLANLASKLTFQPWVSPLTYYLTSLFFVLLAAALAARFFQQRGISPYWILFWALGMGTQVTQSHGLPDAAADALLIISLISLMRQQRLPYMLAVTFAALSREIYILVPASMIAAHFWMSMRDTGLKTTFLPRQLIHSCKRTWIHWIPMLLFAAWQIFLRLKFHVAPSSQASNVLDWPFRSSIHFMLAPFIGIHSIDRQGYLQSIGILLFLALLASAMFVFTDFIRRRLRQSKQPYTEFGAALAFIAMTAMYTCFGSTVMMDNTGYWKATNAFLFFLPFIMIVDGRAPGRWIFLLFLVASLFFSISLRSRIISPPYIFNGKIDFAKSEPTCLKQFRVKILPQSVETRSPTFLRSFSGLDTIVINTEILNTGSEDLMPYQGKGGVSISYRWIRTSDGTVVKDGARTELLYTLAPKQSMQRPVYVQLPRVPGDYILKLSLVQEGCAWFYAEDPASGFDIRYNIR